MNEIPVRRRSPGEIRERLAVAGLPADLIYELVGGLAGEPRAEICCGFAMAYQEFAGVRRYQCVYRYHPAVWVRLETGERITDDDLPVVKVPSDPSAASA